MKLMAEPETSAQEPAHDVLAAEAFAMPAPDPSLHPQPVVLPDDPTGIEEPHDVLAAEEFAMPAARVGGSGGLTPAQESWRLGLRAAAGAAGLAVLLRLPRRRERLGGPAAALAPGPAPLPRQGPLPPTA